MREESSRPVRLLTAALLVAVVLLIVVSWRYRSLTLDARTLSERVTDRYRGMYVPVLERETLEGTPVTVGVPGRGDRQLLLFFNTTCSYCRQSVPPWRDLTERLRDVPSVEIVGIAWDSAPAVRGYVAKHSLSFPVVSFPDVRWTHLFRARSVPYALAVDGDGRVVWAREGVWDGATVDSAVGLLVEDRTNARIDQIDGNANVTSLRPVGESPAVSAYLRTGEEP